MSTLLFDLPILKAKPKEKKAKVIKPTTETMRVVQHFRECYRAANTEDPLWQQWGRELIGVKRQLKRGIPPEVLEDCITYAFESNELFYVRIRGSLQQLTADKVIDGLITKTKPIRDARLTSVETLPKETTDDYIEGM